jgi:phosphatidylserine/phosphatidylglycerophosphate/cardiolipin synthase-like enzyme
MKHRMFTLFGSASLFAIAATAVPHAAFAQGASATGFELEEIVVTARRKDESLQDVPTTINAVTSEDIQKLNFRDFDLLAFGPVVPEAGKAFDLYWNSEYSYPIDTLRKKPTKPEDLAAAIAQAARI